MGTVRSPERAPTFALSAYRLLTGLAHGGLGLLLNKRMREGKEDPARLSERLGLASAETPNRPRGPLIWIHGPVWAKACRICP